MRSEASGEVSGESRDDASVTKPHSSGEVSLSDWTSLITGSQPREKRSRRVNVSITMIPETCFEGKTSQDFLDPSEDPVWVLVHDAGTGDAQFFSMTVNGTVSVVCFKDESAAERCGAALRNKGATTPPAPRSLYLEDLMESLGEDDTVEVCLVDEVIETVIDEDDDSGTTDGLLNSGLPHVVATDQEDSVIGSVPSDASGAQQSSAIPQSVRAMLDRLYDDDTADFLPPDQGDGNTDDAS